MRAIPSPTSTTVPTLRVSTPESNSSMADLMIWVMSSERMAMGRVPLVRASGGDVGEAGTESLETTTHGTVDEAVPDPDLEAAEQAGIDLLTQLDVLAGHGRESRLEGCQLRDRQR